MQIKANIIDVSAFQGVIDWEKVKPHIDGAILRCGFGMDLTEQDDAQFKRNADECTRLGIPFGVYLYSYADSEEKIRSEAQHALRLIKPYRLSYPVYLDLEEERVARGAVERAELFGDIIEQAGYWCGIYANLYWWNTHLKGLERFTKWVAQWGVSQSQYTGSNLDMWQYTAKGKVEGITGDVDMNLCYRDLPAQILPPAQHSFTLQLRTLDQGAAGEDVKALQKLLISQGWDGGEWGADGSFGAQTLQAVQAYQKQQALPVTGQADRALWSRLLGLS